MEKKLNSGLREKGTHTSYKTLLKKLRNFNLVKYGYSDLSFHDLTSDFVQDFDYYLRNILVLGIIRFGCI
ncbi:phage integrase SAM-like domain-containing protein [Sphingobacterium sp.]|uniref:phage integrase SAM-like domain-containing protein n=1 Tax=Sphingobacterium sp. TaxID=341027 RepID=UPI0028A062F0|nr:phage integrase SAM-like domain-containing protein [Sphingobacterium sp.]